MPDLFDCADILQELDCFLDLVSIKLMSGMRFVKLQYPIRAFMQKRNARPAAAGKLFAPALSHQCIQFFSREVFGQRTPAKFFDQLVLLGHAYTPPDICNCFSVATIIPLLETFGKERFFIESSAKTRLHRILAEASYNHSIAFTPQVSAAASLPRLPATARCRGK